MRILGKFLSTSPVRSATRRISEVLPKLTNKEPMGLFTQKGKEQKFSKTKQTNKKDMENKHSNTDS